jgi:sulfoxide reductase heme-binding subunit YedZ
MQDSQTPPDTETGDLAGPAGIAMVAAGILGFVAGSVLVGSSLSPLTWFLARASGFSLYLLFWLSVVSGLGLTTRLLGRNGGRALVWLGHRFTTELAFVFLALHVLALAFDPTAQLGAAGVLLPFQSDLRQPWTDIGILTAWGLIGITLSFSARRFIGQRGWRLLHYGAFPLWIMGLVHGLGSGSDTIQPWAIAIYLGTTVVVLALSLYRLLRRHRPQTTTRIPARSRLRKPVAGAVVGD